MEHRTEKTSVRGSFSYRVADDFSPGGSAAISYSGYEKNNYKLDLSRKLNHAHLLTGSYLADNAWNIGYPVLLMDATLAQAKIYSLTHNWTRHEPKQCVQRHGDPPLSQYRKPLDG